jgi:hypothetical protein
MPRKLLLFAVLAVAGTMLVLWLVTRNSSAEATSSMSSTSSVEGASDRSSTRAPASNDQRARPGEPSLPSDPGAPTRPSDPRQPSDPERGGGQVANVDRGTHADQTSEPPLEYTLPDGRRVRDFRDPKHRKPLEVPPSIHPPGGRKIKPELTGLFSDQIVKHMRACGKPVGKHLLGPKPRMNGQIVITIKNELASVTSAVFVFEDLTDQAAIDTTKQCVEENSLTVTAPAPGEADLDSYSINLSLAFH